MALTAEQKAAQKKAQEKAKAEQRARALAEATADRKAREAADRELEIAEQKENENLTDEELAEKAGARAGVTPGLAGPAEIKVEPATDGVKPDTNGLAGTASPEGVLKIITDPVERSLRINDLQKIIVTGSSSEAAAAQAELKILLEQDRVPRKNARGR